MIKEKRKQTKNLAPKKEDYIQLIVFKLGGEEFGIRIQQVKEVTLTPAIAKVPKSPSFILGIANIRGDIMAIMDLEERMGINVRDRGALLKNPPKYTLVIENEAYTIGLTVQEVPISLTIATSLIDTTPEILRETQINKDFMEGIAKVDEKLIVILDINNMLAFNELKQLATL